MTNLHTRAVSEKDLEETFIISSCYSIDVISSRDFSYIKWENFIFKFCNFIH